MRMAFQFSPISLIIIDLLKGIILQLLQMMESLVPGFNKLTKEEMEAIHTFTLLWTLFEARILDTSASQEKIKEKSMEWDEKTHLKEKWFLPHLEYFKSRYIQNNAPNNRFEQLNFRRNDDTPLVVEVLTGKNTNPRDQLVACLLIVYRIRNNFFHGLKWAYGIKDQQTNFEQSSLLLLKCLEKFGVSGISYDTYQM